MACGSDEEYYDALNDETFGDFSDNEYTSWEDTHQTFFHCLKSEASEIPNQTNTKVEIKVVEASSNIDEQHDDFPSSSSWEAQILRLVGDSDEEETIGIKDSSEKKTQSNPPQDSHNFRNPDVFQNHQGSSCNRRINDSQIFQSELQGQSTSCTTAGNNGTRSQPTRFGNPIPKDAKTVEEIEKELLDEHFISHRSAPPPKYKAFLSCHPKGLLLEDLERNFFRESARSIETAPLPQIPQRNQVCGQQQAGIYSSFLQPVQLLQLPSSQYFNFPVPQIQQQTQNYFPGPPPQQKRHSPPPPYFLHTLPPPPGLQINIKNGIPPRDTGDNKLTTTESPKKSQNDKFLRMTEKDKQKIKSIQIYQLLNDHPFTTDYYYLMFKAKQSTLIGETHLFLRKLFPVKPDDNQTSVYEPPHYENALGQLHVASTLAPKRIIDALVVSVPEPIGCRGSKKKNVKSHQKRHLLLEIEKLYECVLIIEEHRIRACISRRPDRDEDAWKMEVKEQSGKLEKALKNTDKLVKILSVSKGAMLVCRALPLIDRTVMYKVFAQILQVFPIWGWDPAVEANAFVYLKECIVQTDEIGSLITVIGTGMTDNHEIFSCLAESKLGVSLLLCVFHQAENILQTKCHPRMLYDVERLWTKKSMGGISAMLQNNEKLPEPVEFFPVFLQHLQRFPFQRTVVQIFKAVFQRWGRRWSRAVHPQRNH